MNTFRNLKASGFWEDFMNVSDNGCIIGEGFGMMAMSLNFGHLPTSPV